MIHITYFGVLKEELNCAQESIAWQGGDSNFLLNLLRQRNAKWAQALAAEKIFRLALNEEIIMDIVDIPDGSNIAILPPVTGG